MPRNTLKCLDITPRIVILVIWVAATCVFLWDTSVAIMDDENLIVSWVLIGIYILVSALFLWSYSLACWGDPGSLELYYKEIGILDQITIAKNVPSGLTMIPVCEKCHLPKPERTHHCSRCGLCYFRFDHHCPWIGNCVGMKNFKGFFLMPVYGAVLLIVFGVELTIHRYFIYILPFFIVAFVLLIFSFNYIRPSFLNLTTLEEETLKINESPYSKGKCKNFNEFFGGIGNIFLPTVPRVNGFQWSGDDVLNTVLALEQEAKSNGLGKYSKDKKTIKNRKVYNSPAQSDSSAPSLAIP